MSHFLELRGLVERGDLELTQILAPPRTLSTALEIELSEYADGQVHEPFHRDSSPSFEQGCAHIVKRTRELMAQKPERPIRLVSKDLAKHIAPEDWRRLITAVRNVIIIVREPTIQLRSLYRRRINDAVLNEGANTLSESDVLSGLHSDNISWKEQSWENLIRLIKISSQEANLRTAIISAFCLQADRSSTILQLANMMYGNNFVKTNESWVRPKRSSFFSPPSVSDNSGRDREDTDEMGKSGWYDTVMATDRLLPFDASRSSPQSISDYPEWIQDYFLNEVLPIYRSLLLHPDFIIPSDLSIIQTIAQANPIEGYFLAQSYEQKNPVRSAIQIRESAGRYLHTTFPAILDKIKELENESG